MTLTSPTIDALCLSLYLSTLPLTHQSGIDHEHHMWVDVLRSTTLVREAECFPWMLTSVVCLIGQEPSAQGMTLHPVQGLAISQKF